MGVLRHENNMYPRGERISQVKILGKNKQTKQNPETQTNTINQLKLNCTELQSVLRISH